MLTLPVWLPASLCSLVGLHMKYELSGISPVVKRNSIKSNISLRKGLQLVGIRVLL